MAPNGPQCVIKAGAVSMQIYMLMLGVNEQRIAHPIVCLKVLNSTIMLCTTRFRGNRDEDFVSEGKFSRFRQQGLN